jgi:transcriptional regulator GlxA family with amidase domain
MRRRDATDRSRLTRLALIGGRRGMPQHVWILAFPGCQVLDVTGPHEVFALANQLADAARPRYALTVVAPTRGPLVASSGLSIVADQSLSQATGPVDTLIVVGGADLRTNLRDAQLVGWIRRTARRARRIASVCAGAFLLAEAGLPTAAAPPRIGRSATRSSGGSRACMSSAIRSSCATVTW